MVSDARKKKAAQKKADNGVDNVSDGDSALQISDRTCTGDLCSHPVSRDIRIESLPVTFHGHDLIVDSIQIAPPPAIPNQASNRTDLARIADSLEDEYHIGFTRHRPRCHRRYPVLQSNELFNRFSPSHHSATVCSRCYISSFFWDLYVSIRKSVNKLSHTTLLRYYSVERDYSQDRRDPFLHHLLSVIKPTHLFGSLEDVLFIPLICNNVNFNNAANPFSIARFIMNDALVQGLLDCMDAKNSKWRPLPAAFTALLSITLSLTDNGLYHKLSSKDVHMLVLSDPSPNHHQAQVEPDIWKLLQPFVNLTYVAWGGNIYNPRLEFYMVRPLFYIIISICRRYGLLGLNGCGESTLLAAIELRELPVPEHMDIYHLTREIEASDMSALEAVISCDEERKRKLDLEMSALQYMTKEYPGNEEERMRAAIGKFGLTGKAQVMPMKNLSDGQRSRVIFAWLAYRQPHLLLLDEPTNHLDIDHDFRLINQVAEEIWVCENQTVTRWEGNIMDSKAQATSQE
ncbi:hypothetical protein ES332_D13G283900v1 [Gossypium tomentosum]|uniref:ABC transporter domain-containing protein n=1 Tax=Gossypium tomentosum TaxID=34277 RepID=A0A5D2I2Q2_GOSTO|nr:hypothetical protein ES332_D13G283900v1 [Gossypium tomentosum]